MNGFYTKQVRYIKNDYTQERAVMQIRITAPPMITFLRARLYLNASCTLPIFFLFLLPGVIARTFSVIFPLRLQSTSHDIFSFVCLGPSRAQGMINGSPPSGLGLSIVSSSPDFSAALMLILLNSSVAGTCLLNFSGTWVGVTPGVKSTGCSPPWLVIVTV